MSIQVPIANNTPKIMIFKSRWFLIDAKIYSACAKPLHNNKKALIGKELPSQGSQLARCLRFETEL